MLLLAAIPQQATSEQIAQAQRIVMAMFAMAPIFYLVYAFFRGLPFWFVCRKAGFSPWLSLLFLVPMGGFILSYVLAFAEWKVVPAPQMGYMPPAPYPPQPPYPPQA